MNPVLVSHPNSDWVIEAKNLVLYVRLHIVAFVEG